MDHKNSVNSENVLIESKLSFSFKDLASKFSRQVLIKQLDTFWRVQGYEKNFYFYFHHINHETVGKACYKMKLKGDGKKVLSWKYDPVDTSWVEIFPKTFGSTFNYTSFELTVTVRLEKAVVCSASSISPFVKEISKLLDEAAFSDFTFIVQGKEFKVHRNILGFASPVMMKLFTTEMAEKQRQVCEVTDIDPDIFEIMLHFIYYGKTPENIQRIATDLYEAAHYYEVKPLMKICLFNISKILSAATAVLIYEWSDRFLIPDLKAKSWDLIKRCVLKITFKLKQEPLPVSKIHELLEIRRKEKELLDSFKA